MLDRPVIILLHPHFTLPGGAGKYALEVLNYMTDEYRVVAIGQQVEKWWQTNYPKIEFVNIHGPLTSSYWYWLLWPIWYVKSARVITRIKQSTSHVTLICNVFPAQWIGLLFHKFYPAVRTLWFCPEPSAFIYSKEWKKSITSRWKRSFAILFSPLLKVIDQWLVRSVDVIIVNSQFTQTNVQNIYKRTSVVAHPGITTESLPLKNIALRSKRIITVGRLTKFKRVDLLIKAFAATQLSDYQFDIIGKGEELAALQQLIASLKLNNVLIHTSLSDQAVAELYADARLYLSGALAEPFGMSIIEAMAYGTPVIADNSGGPIEIVHNNQTGRLISMTEKNMAEILPSIMADLTLLQKWSEAARRRATTVFTWSATTHIIKQWL